MKKQTIPAARFKSQCLGLLDDIEKGLTQELVVTKRGRPVARVVPIEQPPQRKFRIRFLGDIVGPTEPEWIK